MRTRLWTVLAVVSGVITLAGATGIFVAKHPLDIALSCLVAIGAGSAARYAWRKAQGPRDLQPARLPGGNARPGRSRRR
ncbi:hypothetical protein ACFYYN_21585 [Streptomyces sp. NPDC001902]